MEVKAEVKVEVADDDEASLGTSDCEEDEAEEQEDEDEDEESRLLVAEMHIPLESKLPNLECTTARTRSRLRRRGAGRTGCHSYRRE